MFNLGPMELVVILVLALLIFGPGKLPEVGKALGKSLNEFRRASSQSEPGGQGAARRPAPGKAPSSPEPGSAAPPPEPPVPAPASDHEEPPSGHEKGRSV